MYSVLAIKYNLSKLYSSAKLETFLKKVKKTVFVEVRRGLFQQQQKKKKSTNGWFDINRNSQMLCTNLKKS